ncbi:hypothetical protein Esti_003138 [Eimeria stiedai]
MPSGNRLTRAARECSSGGPRSLLCPPSRRLHPATWRGGLPLHSSPVGFLSRAARRSATTRNCIRHSSALGVVAALSSLSPIPKADLNRAGSLAVGERLDLLDLSQLRRVLEGFVVSSTNSSNSSNSSNRSNSSNGRTRANCASEDTSATLSLFKYLPLLTSARLLELPAADVLLLLHVYGRLLQSHACCASAADEAAAAAAAAPAATAATAAAPAAAALTASAPSASGGSCCRKTSAACPSGERLPRPFAACSLLRVRLAGVLAVFSSLPPAAISTDVWCLLLRRCAEEARSLSPPKCAALLLALSHLPPFPSQVPFSAAVAAACGRLAGAPQALQHTGPLMHMLEALRRLQVPHAPLLTEIARALQRLCARRRPAGKGDGSGGGPQVSPQREPQEALIVAALSCFAAVKATQFQPLFKSLSDALEQRVETLSLQEAAEVLAALGRLDCYPERLLAALLPRVSSLLAAQRPPETEPQATPAAAAAAAAAERRAVVNALQILRALGMLQKRDTSVLRDTVSILLYAAQHDLLSLRDCVSVLYECYRLDLWHQQLAERLISKLQEAPPKGLLESLGLQGATNLLLALSFFRVEAQPLFEALLVSLCSLLQPQLLRHSHHLSTPAISQLQTVELALRTGLLPFSASALSEAARDTLQRAQAAATEPECLHTSTLQEQVAKAATFVQCHYYSEVAVGPYTLDFAKPFTHEELEPLQQCGPQRSLRFGGRDVPLRKAPETLRTKAVVIEVDGPQHFYRDSKHWNSSSKLKHELLCRLGFRIAHIPFYEVLPLSTQKALRDHVRWEEEPLPRSPKTTPPSSLPSLALRETAGHSASLKKGETVLRPHLWGPFYAPVCVDRLRNAVLRALRPSEMPQVEDVNLSAGGSLDCGADASAAMNRLLEAHEQPARLLSPAERKAAPHSIPDEAECQQLSTSTKTLLRAARRADKKKALLVSVTRLRRRKARERRRLTQQQQQQQ